MMRRQVSADATDPAAELLRSWQDHGDLEALDRLLKLEVGVLKHMIRGREGRAFAGSASASDLAQEAVMGLLTVEKAPTFSDPRQLRSYLWRSAWRLLLRKFEKRKRPILTFDGEEPAGLSRLLSSPTAFSNLDRAERAAAVDLALNLLDPEDRELIRRVYFDDEDIATAGAAVGLTRTAANSRLVRARRALATCLAEWAEVIG
jgi:RNA polymerase sigma factor (sigma-70 family)